MRHIRRNRSNKVCFSLDLGRGSRSSTLFKSNLERLVFVPSQMIQDLNCPLQGCCDLILLRMQDCAGWASSATVCEVSSKKGVKRWNNREFLVDTCELLAKYHSAPLSASSFIMRDGGKHSDISGSSKWLTAECKIKNMIFFFPHTIAL